MQRKRPSEGLLMFAMLALGCTSLYAQAHIVAMRGAPTCEVWLKDRATNAKVHEAWLLGYLSGMAQELDKDLPHHVTEAEIFRWMDEYCKQSPKHQLSLGGYSYFARLREHMK